jgi:hypothetical protein
MSPVQADQETRQHAPGQEHLSQRSKRDLERLALTAALAVGVIAALITGVAIGSAVRKRIDKWGHGYFLHPAADRWPREMM